MGSRFRPSGTTVRRPGVSGTDGHKLMGAKGIDMPEQPIEHDVQPSSLTLVSDDRRWIDCLREATDSLAGELTVVAPTAFTHWPPPPDQDAAICLLDCASDVIERLSVDVRPAAGGPHLVLLGDDCPSEALPESLRPRVLTQLDHPPAPPVMRAHLELWMQLLTQREARESATSELEDQKVQVQLLSGKLKRMEEWVDLLNRQRSSMGTVMEKFNMLSRLGQQINVLDVNKIADICIEKIPLLVDARWASLYLYDPATDELVLTRHNQQRDLSERVRLCDVPNSLMAGAIERREVLVIKDINELKQQQGINVERANRDVYKSGTCIVAPLLSADRVVGVLNLTGKTTGEFFDELNDLPAVEHLSHLMGAAIRNCQLFHEVEEQARSDSMTGFLNHRAFLEDLGQELGRIERYGNPPSVMMIDCDKFKNINDTYGHPAGDHVIREIAQLIRESIRSQDRPCRYGGDEFAVILLESDAKVARMVGKRLLDRIHAHAMVYGEMNVHVTLSIGICQHTAGRTTDDLVRGADEALYEAKEAGRDRVVVHELEPAPVTDATDESPASAESACGARGKSEPRD